MRAHYADARALMTRLAGDYAHNPIGHLVTCGPALGTLRGTAERWSACSATTASAPIVHSTRPGATLRLTSGLRGAATRCLEETGDAFPGPSPCTGPDRRKEQHADTIAELRAGRTSCVRDARHVAHPGALAHAHLVCCTQGPSVARSV
ncbi:hypothetical protein GCM10018952_09950 [Streptosporangium vulgare]